MADLNDVKLSTQDILKKQFKHKVKGLDPDEVDTYLDQVISDYETFQQIIEDLYGQIGQLQRALMEAKKSAAGNDTPAQVRTRQEERLKTYEPNGDVREHHHESSTNMAIIQRISTLERKVYSLEQHIYGLQKK